jgi:MinD-like ATPase involved in chromosome partitioning or flagellar assembly
MRAPNLNFVFNVGPSKWFNDFLDGRCEIQETFTTVNVGSKKGILALSLSDPARSEEMIDRRKERERELESIIKVLVDCLATLSRQGFDVLLFDTPPGYHVSAANAIVVSNSALVVLRPNKSDLAGTRTLVEIIYSRVNALRGNIHLLVNNFVPEKEDPNADRRIADSISEAISYDARVVGVIPHYCELLRASEEYVHALENPQHPFVRVLADVAGHIGGIDSLLRK